MSLKLAAFSSDPFASPEMAYDRELTPEGTPGYFTLGRLFANGYLKALLKGAGGYF